jgi:hypothetical protein
VALSTIKKHKKKQKKKKNEEKQKQKQNVFEWKVLIPVT